MELSKVQGLITISKKGVIHAHGFLDKNVNYEYLIKKSYVAIAINFKEKEQYVKNDKSLVYYYFEKTNILRSGFLSEDMPVFLGLRQRYEEILPSLIEIEERLGHDPVKIEYFKGYIDGSEFLNPNSIRKLHSNSKNSLKETLEKNKSKILEKLK